MICEQCGTRFAAADTGRPRRYCSARCRQRAYRAREVARTGLDPNDEALGALARRIRDNADRLWLFSQGWHPPTGETLARLAEDTARLAQELADLRRARPDET